MYKEKPFLQTWTGFPNAKGFKKELGRRRKTWKWLTQNYDKGNVWSSEEDHFGWHCSYLKLQLTNIFEHPTANLCQGVTKKPHIASVRTWWAHWDLSHPSDLKLSQTCIPKVPCTWDSWQVSHLFNDYTKSVFIPPIKIKWVWHAPSSRTQSRPKKLIGVRMKSMFHTSLHSLPSLPLFRYLCHSNYFRQGHLVVFQLSRKWMK